MKIAVIIFFIMLSNLIYAQINPDTAFSDYALNFQTKMLTPAKYKHIVGTYGSVSINSEKGGVKIAVTYVEDNIFRMEYLVFKGLPYYNSEKFTDTIKIKNNQGIFTDKNNQTDCETLFKFSKNKVTVTTVHCKTLCGNGRRIQPKWVYKKIKNK